MNEAICSEYDKELFNETEVLFGELIFVQRELETARKCGDTDEYAKLIRVYLPLQKQYLKLCAEQEKREQLEADTDPLTEFNRV